MGGADVGRGEGRPGRRPGGGRAVTALTWALLLLGLWLWGRHSGLTGGPTPSAQGATTGHPPGFAGPPAHEPLDPVTPVRVEIPSIHVRAPVAARGLDKAGAIDPPPYGNPGLVGWYGGGVRPGARGAALLVGHVDTDTRPAVFYHLSTLRPGDRVRVTRRDGSRAEFTVDDVQVLDRAGFDARRAYGPRDANHSELRIITCGGDFDRAHRTYTANVVVSAYLTGAAPR
ncbi:class F sortase [Streptomyces sp. NPDC007088]|uniref:class F sortase n=1 Tax=Streptomyces sp. NPDC007088 TaxID=3364773 RepID=UPI0036B2BCF3